MTNPTVQASQRALASGNTAKVVVVHAKTLEATALHAPAHVRAQDLAHHLGQRYQRSFVTCALPPHSLRAFALPESLQQHEETQFLSLRSALMTALQRHQPEWHHGRWRTEHDTLDQVLQHAQRKGILALAEYRISRAPTQELVPIGSLGFPRQLGHHLPRAIISNTHFFLLDLLELDSPYAAIGDPAGMLAAHARILHPPLLPRATLIRTEDRWMIKRPSVEDLEIRLPDGTRLYPSPLDDAMLYYRGQLGIASHTPRRPGAFEVCFQGRYPTVIHHGGHFPIPHGALVLSWGKKPAKAVVQALTSHAPIQYSIPILPTLITAVQAGPQLLKNNEVILTEHTFEQEAFHTFGHATPASPLIFPTDMKTTIAARTGIGIKADGTLVLVAVEGSSSLAAQQGIPSQGCTLYGLAHLLREEGAVDALNLDGGGSTQLYSGAGTLLTPSDNRGTQHARFERPIPVACIVN